MIIFCDIHFFGFDFPSLSLLVSILQVVNGHYWSSILVSHIFFDASLFFWVNIVLEVVMMDTHIAGI